MNDYRILGLDTKASQDEAKQAYKKLALLHHPDRGGDPKEFAKITKAYQNIKNSSNTENVYFHQSFYPNKNIRINQEITFAEQFTGKIVNINYKTTAGTIKDITVTIPPGISDGQTITFDNYGDNNFSSMSPGKLYLQVNVKHESNMYRSNDDVHINHKVAIFDLILGATIDVQLPNKETINLNIKPGTKPNTVFCIPGYGIPNLGTRQRGDIYLKVEAIMPHISDKKIILDLDEIRKKI
jgi:DnaJ-class molecular chaperone